MRSNFNNLLSALLLVANALFSQNNDLNRLPDKELQMTFPSIYFKHNSTDYAEMPYKVDSCFKYIALHFDQNINSLVIWRDSLETEALTKARIKKLSAPLKKHLRKNNFEIISMADQQKISRYTLQKTVEQTNRDYLLSLNSCFDFSKTKVPLKTTNSHIIRPKIWCKDCWKNGFHLDKKSRTLRKIARKNKSSIDQKKERRKLVWTGWKTGFHWSMPRK